MDSCRGGGGGAVRVRAAQAVGAPSRRPPAPRAARLLLLPLLLRGLLPLALGGLALGLHLLAVWGAQRGVCMRPCRPHPPHPCPCPPCLCVLVCDCVCVCVCGGGWGGGECALAGAVQGWCARGACRPPPSPSLASHGRVAWACHSRALELSSTRQATWVHNVHAGQVVVVIMGRTLARREGWGGMRGGREGLQAPPTPHLSSPLFSSPRHSHPTPSSLSSSRISSASPSS